MAARASSEQDANLETSDSDICWFISVVLSCKTFKEKNALRNGELSVMVKFFVIFVMTALLFT